jgi:hypothetical protein
VPPSRGGSAVRVLCVSDLFLSLERIREAIIKEMGRDFGPSLGVNRDSRHRPGKTWDKGRRLAPAITEPPRYCRRVQVGTPA